MSLMSGISGTHGHAQGRGPLDTWRLWSPPALGGESGATGHVSIPKPCRVVVLVPRGTLRHRSPLLAGGTLYATGHVVTPEPSSGMWRALCYGARGDAGTLSWWVARSMPQDTWRRWSSLLVGGALSATGHVAIPKPSLAPGASLEPWG
jgi:hypothetical protein